MYCGCLKYITAVHPAVIPFRSQAEAGLFEATAAARKYKRERDELRAQVDCCRPYSLYFPPFWSCYDPLTRDGIHAQLDAGDEQLNAKFAKERRVLTDQLVQVDMA